MMINFDEYAAIGMRLAKERKEKAQRELEPHQERWNSLVKTVQEDFGDKVFYPSEMPLSFVDCDGQWNFILRPFGNCTENFRQHFEIKITYHLTWVGKYQWIRLDACEAARYIPLTRTTTKVKEAFPTLEEALHWCYEYKGK